MSFVTIDPELLSAAASNLQGVGHAVNAEMASAAAPTTGVAAPAADPVSGLTAALFGSYAQVYQAIAAEAAAVHEQFVTTMSASANSYAATEAANAASAASTSSTTEIEGVLETWINSAITSPAQVYLSAIVPYLLGIVTSATALTFEPVAAAPGAGLVSDDGPAVGPDRRNLPGSASGSSTLASAESAGSDAETGTTGALGRTVTMDAFSAPRNVSADSVISTESALPDTELGAASPVPAAGPRSIYGEPPPAAPAGHAAEIAGSRVGSRSVNPRSPAGG